MNDIISKIKNEIKELSNAQKFLRDQRKTKYNKLDRVVEPNVAQYRHRSNRLKLRHLYILYGELRNRPVSYKATDHMLMKRLREKYKIPSAKAA